MTKLEKMRDEIAEKWWIGESLSQTYDYDLEWVFKQGFDASTAYHAELIKELVKALEFYNDQDEFGDLDLSEYSEKITEDAGDRAKQALENYKKSVE